MMELHNERAVCQKALEQYGIEVIAFEDYGASPDTPEAAYLDAVAEAHVYIGIFWNRYSLATCQEYEQAAKLGKPCFLYHKTFAYGSCEADLEAFLKSLKSRHVVRTFSNASDLADVVWRDLQTWLISFALRAQKTAEQQQSLHATELSLTANELLEVYEENPEDRLRFERSLADLQRLARDDADAQPYMAISTQPPFISRPWDVQMRRQRRVYSGNPGTLEDLLATLKERYALWEQLVDRCDIYLLIDKAAHEAYFRAGRAGSLDFTPEEVLEQRDRYVQLLQTYPRYQVALHADPVPTTYMICGSRMVVLYGGTVPTRDAIPFTGIRGLRTSHPPTVLRFRLSFEKAWQSLPAQNKDKDAVVHWLRSL